MPNNELVLLDQLLERRQNERTEAIPADTAFEIFACEQIMRRVDLSPSEVEAGVVGGGNDGAIDGVYVLLDDTLVEEDSDLFSEGFSIAKVASNTRLSVWMIQAKREESFAETPIDLVASSTRRLLDLGESEDDLRRLYSDALVAKFSLFRRSLQLLAPRHPNIDIRYAYTTRGSTQTVNAKVLAKAADLEAQFRAVVFGATACVEFLGASELWQAATTLPTYTLSLPYKENATSGTSHVALVSLRDYLAFLADERGVLRRHIFDWNVRDYQGDVEVNQEIQAALEDPNGVEFWWLNNGVTVICSQASIVARTYSLSDVQIVNGLQTSHTVYRTLRNAPPEHPALERSVLVRFWSPIRLQLEIK